MARLLPRSRHTGTMQHERTEQAHDTSKSPAHTKCLRQALQHKQRREDATWRLVCPVPSDFPISVATAIAVVSRERE